MQALQFQPTFILCSLPSTLSSSAHPQHELKLLNTAELPLGYHCDVSRQEIQGIFYHCMGNCNFDAHPHCVKPIPDQSPLTPKPPTTPPPPPQVPGTQSRSFVGHQVPYSYGHVPPAVPHYSQNNYGPSNMYAAHPPYYPNYTPHMQGPYGVPFSQVGSNNTNNIGNQEGQGNNAQPNNNGRWGFRKFIYSVTVGLAVSLVSDGLLGDPTLDSDIE